MDYDYDFDESFDDGYDLGYDEGFDDSRDVQPDLTKVMNDDGFKFNQASMGMALAFAEELEDEVRYSQADRLSRIRNAPNDSTVLVSLRPKSEKVMGRGKFEAHVDEAIAKRNSKMPV